MIYLASDNQRVKRTARIENPEYTPERINLHIVIPELDREITRSLIPDELEAGVFEAEFDLNNLLSGELKDYLVNKPRFAYPADPSTPIIDRTGLMLEFYTDESYTYIDENGDIQLADRTDNSSNTDYALLGGISYEMQAYLYSQDLSFVDWLSNEESMKWLSWLPNNLPVNSTQPLRLWLLNNNVIDAMKLMLQVTFTDGSASDPIQKYASELGFGLHEIICGPEELGISDVDESKTVSSYSVWIEGTGGSTDKRTFVLDYSSYERNDTLFFHTSLGQNEVLWCHGRRSEQRNFEGEQTVRPYADPLPRIGTIQAKRRSVEHTYQMNTGWFPKSMCDYLADILSGGEAILATDYRMLPVIIEDGKFNFKDDDEDLYSLSFKMTVAHSDKHYSVVPKVDESNVGGQFTETFNEDFLT